MPERTMADVEAENEELRRLVAHLESDNVDLVATNADLAEEVEALRVGMAAIYSVASRLVEDTDAAATRPRTMST